MQSTDPLTNALQHATRTRRDAREAVVKAVLADAPADSRQRAARRAHAAAEADLGRQREAFPGIAREVVKARRRALFGVNDAPHARRDPLSMVAETETAKAYASAIKTEPKAVEALRACIADRHGHGVARAGAIAELALAKGWRDALDCWALSSLGMRRGGPAAIEALAQAEAWAAGAIPPALAPLPSVETLAGDRWPALVSA